MGVVRVWSASRWAPWSSCIWRGSVGVIERKVWRLTYSKLRMVPRVSFNFFIQFRQTTQSGLLFPGFSLCLSPDVAESALRPSLFEEVGLVPTYSPSHLQMLQAVDTLAVPLFWYSHFKCKLYPLHRGGFPLVGGHGWEYSPWQGISPGGGGIQFSLDKYNKVLVPSKFCFCGNLQNSAAGFFQ